MADLDHREIKVVSVTTPHGEEVPYSNPDRTAKVFLRIRKEGPEFPVYVSRDVVSDENSDTRRASLSAFADAEYRDRDCFLATERGGVSEGRAV